MKTTMRIAAVALAFAAGAAVAGPTDLGGGTGDFTFNGIKDGSFFVTLNPGTYEFTTTVTSANGMSLDDVWLSTTHDQNPNGKGTLGIFTEVNPQLFTGTLQVTVPMAEPIYLEVNTLLGKSTHGNYTGTLMVSSVPEPASLALLATGLALFGFLGRRRRG